jgi:alanine dehydrogenase
MIRVLSGEDVGAVLDLSALLPVVEDAFVKQGRGAVERPERPHFPVGAGLEDEEPLGTGLTMPAYLHGDETFATKLVSVHEGNVDRDLPAVNAQVVVADAATGQPLAFLEGNRITAARTGCVGGLAARELATGPVRLGLVGAGTQARWQARAIAAATDLERVRIFAPDETRFECEAVLSDEFDVPVAAVSSPDAAIEDANVVVTATTSPSPVFPGENLEPGTLVVAIGAYTADMQEIDATTFERAARVFADVPEEVAAIGDAIEAGLEVEDLLPFSSVFEGEAGRETDDEIVVVDSVGSAVMDAATAGLVYERAVEEDVGTNVQF